MKHIGIMGGTFNPVHNAHLVLAQAATEEFKLDETWFIPSKNPPYKSNRNLINDKLRLEMLNLATEGNSYFRVSNIELLRDGPTYTVDTLKELRSKYPEYNFSFLIGGDSVMQFKSWYKPEEICTMCRLIATGRGDYPKAEILAECSHIRERYEASIEYLDIPSMDISSSFIRGQIEKGNCVRYYLPDRVYSYIVENKLYET